jgi:TolB-like protein/DNA-binding winged helix-turn-helix (wHTH) protein/predicted Zn-dependent protease
MKLQNSVEQNLQEYMLGEWLVRPAEGTLDLDGQLTRLEPRVMDVLAYLAAQPGRVVSKEELLSAVWGNSFVEEGALTQVIHSLRKALGDDARHSRYVQTLPKRGYRLVASISIKKESGERIAGNVSTLSLEPLTLFGQTSRTRVLLVLAGLMAIVVLSWAWSHSAIAYGKLEQPALAVDGGMRIIILPFENLGRPEQAFFAGGVTEEITKDLASLSALQVISRTSAMYYAKTNKSLAEIGKELGVDYVLEGTVRWATASDGRARVRVIPQLIRVADDSQVWTDVYDRKVTDIFEVQAEISRRVINQLGIALVPNEKQALGAPPTESLEAYRAYLRGLDFKNQPFYSEQQLRLAIPMFRRAVELDPEFAVAWAELSQAHSYLAFNSDRSPGRIQEAKMALDRAVALSPNLPAVHLARAYFTYRCMNDYSGAYQELAAATRVFPNNSEILQNLGFVLRRQGRLADAIEELKHAFRLDPHTVKLVWAIAETYWALRDYEQADRYYSQAISLAPDQPVYWEERALNRLAWTGKVQEARATLAEAPIPEQAGLIPIEFQLDFYDRNYERALARLSSKKLSELPLLEQSRLNALAALSLELSGDPRRGRAAAESNRNALEAQILQFPGEPFYKAYLAVTLAQLNRTDEALARADEAALEKRKDAFTGPRIVEMQALVDALLGQHHKAISRLARLLVTPYQAPLSHADLRLSPIWDPLRSEPEFQALLLSAAD